VCWPPEAALALSVVDGWPARYSRCPCWDVTPPGAPWKAGGWPWFVLQVWEPPWPSPRGAPRLGRGMWAVERDFVCIAWGARRLGVTVGGTKRVGRVGRVQAEQPASFFRRVGASYSALPAAAWRLTFPVLFLWSGLETKKGNSHTQQKIPKVVSCTLQLSNFLRELSELEFSSPGLV